MFFNTGREAPPPGWRPEAAASTASRSYATVYTHELTLLRLKKNIVFPVTLPTPIFGPYPKIFIKIFLFFIKSYIMLFV